MGGIAFESGVGLRYQKFYGLGDIHGEGLIRIGMDEHFHAAPFFDVFATFDPIGGEIDLVVRLVVHEMQPHIVFI